MKQLSIIKELILVILLFTFNSCTEVNTKEKSNTENQKSLLFLEGKTILLRTDFNSKEDSWKTFYSKIKTFNDIHVINDSTYKGTDTLNVYEKLPENYNETFVFIVDSVTLNNPLLPILCIDLFDRSGLNFRFIPTELKGVNDNLFTANMGFEEFIEYSDSNGIFKGFNYQC